MSSFVGCGARFSALAFLFAMVLPAGADEYFIVDIPDAKHYYQAHQDKGGGFGINEFVPRGQTVHRWREMVTMLTDYRNRPSSPKSHARRLMKGSARDCNGPGGKILASGKRGGYRYALFFQECPLAKETGDPEWDLYLAIKGRDSFYTLIKAWKSKPSASDLSYWRGVFKKAYVCDTRRSGPACPEGLK
jgi:hypothetical protein